MLSSGDTRRGQLSVVVRLGNSAALDTATSNQAEYVWTNGPEKVTVEVPESKSTPGRRGSYEVAGVLPTDATRQEIYTGVGHPVVQWLWDGFNAVILSYGGACTGKTSMLLGKKTTPLNMTKSAEAQLHKGGTRSHAANERQPGAKNDAACDAAMLDGGLIVDILHGIFNQVRAEASPSLVVGNEDDAYGIRKSPTTSTGVSSALSSYSAEKSRTQGARVQESGSAERTQSPSVKLPRNGELAQTQHIVIAISAWQIDGNRVQDLLLSSNASTGASGASLKAGEGCKRGRRGMEGSQRGAAGSGEKGRRRRSRGRSRGRSGSDDSSSTGNPDGFLAVEATDIVRATFLIDTARRRAGVIAAEAGVGQPGGNKRHSRASVFFRVVVYRGVQETVSTLHVVDLAEGPEVSRRKQAGKGGGRSSASSSPKFAPRPGDRDEFASMIAGLVSPAVPTDCVDAEANGSALPDAVRQCNGVVNGCERLVSSSASPSLSGTSDVTLAGGSSKLIEALCPLVSGNARSWLVVSVGGHGSGGAQASWNALEAARQASGITTTCIRLRGVALGDLHVRKALDVDHEQTWMPQTDDKSRLADGRGLRADGKGSGGDAAEQTLTVRFSPELTADDTERAHAQQGEADHVERVGMREVELGARPTTLCSWATELGQEKCALNDFLNGFSRGGELQDDGRARGVGEALPPSSQDRDLPTCAAADKGEAALLSDVDLMLKTSATSTVTQNRQAECSSGGASRSYEQHLSTSYCSSSASVTERLAEKASGLAHNLERPFTSRTSPKDGKDWPAGEEHTRRTIDRVVSSLLGDMLPASPEPRTAECSAAPKGARGRSDAKHSVRTTTAPAPLPANTEPAARPRSKSEGASEQVMLLTPIEVLMHAPAGASDARQPNEADESRPRPARGNSQSRRRGGSVARGKGKKSGKSVSRDAPTQPPADKDKIPSATVLVRPAAENTHDPGGRSKAKTLKGGGSMTSCRDDVAGTDANKSSICAEASCAAAKGGVDKLLVTGGASSKGEQDGPREGTGDTTVQHRTNAALLRVVREQEERARQMKGRFDTKENEWLERMTGLEAELEGLRAQAVELKGRLRRAEASSPFVETFARYEAHAELLEAENASLREANLSLELRVLDLVSQSRSARTKTSATISTSTRATEFVSQRADIEDAEQDEYGGRNAVSADVGRRAFERSSATAETRKFRVDGRVAAGFAHEASPTCLAALRDLRRRLKEAQGEVKAFRLGKSDVDKRDRQCQAQLRCLSEYQARLRDLSRREREQDSALVASRLECARAEAVAGKRSDDVSRLLEEQATMRADMDALMQELAAERRRSRRFDEDRRAYGHIRRFIEQHAGGRPAEWDEEVDADRLPERGRRRVPDAERGRDYGSRRRREAGKDLRSLADQAWPHKKLESMVVVDDCNTQVDHENQRGRDRLHEGGDRGLRFGNSSLDDNAGILAWADQRSQTDGYSTGFQRRKHLPDLLSDDVGVGQDRGSYADTAPVTSATFTGQGGLGSSYGSRGISSGAAFSDEIEAGASGDEAARTNLWSDLSKGSRNHLGHV